MNEHQTECDVRLACWLVGIALFFLLYQPIVHGECSLCQALLAVPL